MMETFGRMRVLSRVVHPCHDSAVSRSVRRVSSRPYFITTPIFYVNAAPHIGHLYTALLGDAASRWRRLKGQTTLFTTGTDEHGQKIQQAAIKAGMDPNLFCDQNSHKFRTLFDATDILYDTYVRTTSPEHKIAAQTVWNKLVEGGHIRPGSYTGWYSVPDEAFLSQDDITLKTLADGSRVEVSKESGHPVVWMEEKNYMFSLANFQSDLLYWLNSSPIHPKQYEHGVRQILQSLSDLSVSRDRTRLPWGIPVPGDETQTIYVWLEALVNYLTVANYPRDVLWPPDVQLIGKDIVRFHAVYWPAFLMGAGLEPPRKLVVHDHWMVDNLKMSKSLGNVVDPLEKISIFGVDGLRYFLLKEGSLESSGTYTDIRVAERVNSDLANTLGNLLGRCTAASVNKQQRLPPLVEDNVFEYLSKEERDVHQSLYNIPAAVDELYQDFYFTKALDLIMSRLHWTNGFVQSHEPWRLSKSTQAADGSHLDTVLHVAMESLRVCGILLQPVVPDLANRLLTRLGVPLSERDFSSAQHPAVRGYKELGQNIVLQKKVDV